MELLNAQSVKSFARSKLDNSSLNNKDLAGLFHCGESTVSEILAKKEQWLR